MKATARILVASFLLPACSISTIRAPESQFSLTQKPGKCVVLSRRLTASKFFEARFNAMGSWNGGEERLKEWFVKNRFADKVIVVSPGAFRTQEPDDLRFIAGRFGCTSAVSYRESVVEDSSVNVLSVLYAAILPLFFIPGNNLQLGIQWNVSAVDVASGRSLFEGKWYGVSPLYHFRPGNYNLVWSRAYRAAIDEVIERGTATMEQASFGGKKT